MSGLDNRDEFDEFHVFLSLRPTLGRCDDNSDGSLCCQRLSVSVLLRKRRLAPFLAAMVAARRAFTSGRCDARPASAWFLDLRPPIAPKSLAASRIAGVNFIIFKRGTMDSEILTNAPPYCHDRESNRKNPEGDTGVECVLQRKFALMLASQATAFLLRFPGVQRGDYVVEPLLRDLELVHGQHNIVVQLWKHRQPQFPVRDAGRLRRTI